MGVVMKTIELPWPVTALWSNHRTHWRKKAAAKAKSKHDACIIALAAGLRKGTMQPPIYLRFEFHPPDNRKRDLHNMPETQKAAIDGIQDALGIDDSRFVVRWPDAFSAPCKLGKVVVHISGSESVALRGDVS
jgi:crossover junction endodeoxyribonuclease RusA